MTNAPKSTAATIEQLVAAEQVRALYGGINVTSLGAPASASTLVLLMWSAVDHRITAVWLSLFVLAAGPINLAVGHYFRKNHRLPGDAARWLRVFAYRQLGTSVLAGCAGVVLWVPESLLYQMILLCFLSIACAMIIMEIAYHRIIYWITLCAFLAPLIVRASIEPAARVVALTAAVVLVYFLLNARAANRLIMESLRLRFLNEDLISQLRSEKSLAETARRDAVEANQAKSRFLAAASHDLRQPVHALGLFASALRPHVAAGQGLDIVDKIESSITSTESMFNALLDISRLDPGILMPDIKAVAVGELLNRLGLEYAPRAEAKGLVLRVRPCACAVMSDALLLERILRNYLSNAIRYTERGGVLVGCRVRGAMLSIEVWDTGQGIPANKLQDIYQEFFQIGNPERDRTKGLGLGLAIVKRAGELLAHPIAVRSVQGRGSMFSVAAPLTNAATQSAIENGLAPTEESILVGALVLVIDDEADALNAARVLLRQWGCAVVTAESQTQALAALRELHRAPDAVLSDYRLRDGETGIAAIQAIEREWGPAPAALLTGDVAPDRLIEATHSGYVLLHKPVLPTRLKATLCRLLTESRRRHALPDGRGDDNP